MKGGEPTAAGSVLADLDKLYKGRFGSSLEYRRRVWGVLADSYFSRLIHETEVVLDLGCGYGEFINRIVCGRKFAMDANADAARYLAEDVEFLCQDSTGEWKLPSSSLDVVFTSNFLEHLSSKQALIATLAEIHRCLKPGGRIIAMGPNVRFVGGAYWDFWDHHVALSDRSLGEAMEISGFTVAESIARFLPYTMSETRKYPIVLLRLYLMLPMAWRLFGKQFLIVAVRRNLETDLERG